VAARDELDDIPLRTRFQWAVKARAGATFEHQDIITAVAWSPDGTRLATASEDKTARVGTRVRASQCRLRLSIKTRSQRWRGALMVPALSLPACEAWDTCAPEAILRAAGGVLTDLCGEPLRYDDAELGRLRGLVASNGDITPTSSRALPIGSRHRNGPPL